MGEDLGDGVRASCLICGKGIYIGRRIDFDEPALRDVVIEHLMECFEEWFWEKSNFLIASAFWEQGILDGIQDAHDCLRHGINHMVPLACRIALDTVLTESLSTCIIIATVRSRRFATGALGFTSNKRFSSQSLYWNALSSIARKYGIIDLATEKSVASVRSYGNERAHVFAQVLENLSSESEQMVVGRPVLSNVDALELFALTLSLIVKILERWLVIKTWAYRRIFSGDLRGAWPRRMRILPCGCIMNDARQRLKQRRLHYHSWSLEAIEASHVRPIAAYRLAHTKEAYDRMNTLEAERKQNSHVDITS